MKKIELVSGIQSSVLGFGCAPIVGSVDKNKSARALSCALDLGVNHFDLARSYGYGDAERFVGNILKPKRQDVIIASKFGIKISNKVKFVKPLKPIIRFMRELKKSNATAQVATTVAQTNKIADSLHYRIPLTVKEMSKSFEESLKALQTDYLDYYFIHEPNEAIIEIDELSNFAGKLKKEGKIRAWGLAYMKDKEHIHKDYLNRFDILQFNNSPGIEKYNNIVDERHLCSNIFFSPIKGGDVALSAEDKLKTLHKDFPKSVILCSMFNEKHLTNNAKLFID